MGKYGHSPGPWELAEDGELISADRFTVAWVEQAEPADAALIAAAPTMKAEIAEVKAILTTGSAVATDRKRIDALCELFGIRTIG